MGKEESKVKNVTRNTFMGVFNNLALVFLNLVSRKMFLNYIGIEYLSIGQVINNILSILAFSELGVTNSVLYMLYKPVAENDEIRITKIIEAYKKINRCIGYVIFLIGVLCIPFLNKFIDTSVDIKTVHIIFIINLIYSATTYFCSYRQVLINANQKNYVVSKISLVVNFISIFVQCVVILFTHSYIIYLLVTVVMGLSQNILIYFKAGEMYPYIKKHTSYKLDEVDKKNLINNVKSMFSVKICGIVINNTDNVLVSVIDTMMVGYCANYTIISTRLRGIISIFHNSVIYSLGIANVEKTQEEKYELFKRFQLINVFLACFTSVLLGTLWDDFIRLWIGERFLIPTIILYSILLNYLWVIVTAGIWMFRDTNGLFIYVKKMLVVNASINLIISILLGKVIGVAGVYLATIVADILSDFWYDTKLVYNKVFGRTDWWKYIVYIFVNIGIVMAVILTLNTLTSTLTVSIINWIIKAIIAAVVYITLFVALYGRTKTFHNVVEQYLTSRLRSRR